LVEIDDYRSKSSTWTAAGIDKVLVSRKPHRRTKSRRPAGRVIRGAAGLPVTRPGLTGCTPLFADCVM